MPYNQISIFGRTKPNRAGQRPLRCLGLSPRLWPSGSAGARLLDPTAAAGRNTRSFSSNPSCSCTLGSHEGRFCAKLMSGQRCLGSSSGKRVKAKVLQASTSEVPALSPHPPLTKSSPTAPSCPTSPLAWRGASFERAQATQGLVLWWLDRMPYAWSNVTPQSGQGVANSLETRRTDQ
jgi:hypothetical protein